MVVALQSEDLVIDLVRFAPVVAIAVVAFAFHNVYRQDRAVLFPPGSLAVPAAARQGDRAIRQEPD